jgi:HD-GYP domain-containing protein (c-di-GMP phosphodiesterase class II)
MSSSQTTLTKDDIKKIEQSVEKVLKISREGQRLDPALLDLLNQLVDSLNQLRLTVEFDHEERLRAIEDFLKDG